MSLPQCAVAFALFAAIIASRHPAVLTQANFWAEDGAVWYPAAMAHGLHSLLHPVNGYLQTAARLAALLVQPLPLRWAPTAFALLALAAQALPPTLLVSDRLRGAWPSRPARWLAALLYVALPNAFEVYVNVTNVQWHLAVAAFLVLQADPPRGSRARWFDPALLALACLSGPFCLALAPVALWRAWSGADRVTLRRLGVVCGAALVQISQLATTAHAARSNAPLGADPLLLARIVSYQVILGGMLGAHALASVLAWPAWQSGLLPVALCLAGSAMALHAVSIGPSILRQFFLFAGIILGGALLSPMVDLTRPQWPVLLSPHAGGRYWFIPILALMGLLIGLLGAPDRLPRLIGLGALVVVAWNMPSEWRLWPYGDPPGFVEAARRFDSAAVGTSVTLPIRPQGWHMTLVR